MMVCRTAAYGPRAIVGQARSAQRPRLCSKGGHDPSGVEGLAAHPFALQYESFAVIVPARSFRNGAHSWPSKLPRSQHAIPAITIANVTIAVLADHDPTSPH